MRRSLRSAACSRRLAPEPGCCTEPGRPGACAFPALPVSAALDSLNIRSTCHFFPVDFKVVGRITQIENIASGRGIRELARLNKFYGKTRWRKLKGIANIKLSDGTLLKAELHWYEGHGAGKKEIKIKRYIN